MSENFVKNSRYFANKILKFSWIVGLLTFLIVLILGQNITGAALLGVIVWIKWLVIGFVIRTFFDMFLIRRVK